MSRCASVFSPISAALLQQIPRGMLFDGIENGVVLANSYVYAHKTTRERLQSVFKEVDNESMDPEVHLHPF
jgi:hypothetical protein